MAPSRSASQPRLSSLQDEAHQEWENCMKSGFTIDFPYKIEEPTKGSDGTHKFSVELNKEKAAFVLGKNGKTKVKISRVAGCSLDLAERDYTLHGSGQLLNCRRCLKYLKCLTQQREGPVSVSEKKGDGDLTLLDIPQDAVGFVTGKNGNFLRQIEEEWDVLMFFAESEDAENAGVKGARDFEKLAIFGTKEMRRGAELKVCSAVEAKMQGFFDANEDAILDRDYVQGVDWKTDVLKFKDDELSFALGKRGATRRKLEQASECIVQYIGDKALFSGTEAQRNRIKTYMRWLFDQLEGPVEVPDFLTRSDITVVEVPQEVVGYVTGAKRQTLSATETEFGTMMFFMGAKTGKNAVEKLAIFGPPRNRTGAELKVKWSVELKCTGYYSRHFRQNKDEWANEGFQTDILELDPDFIGYVLGKSGVTRQKLGTAANVYLQYIGHYAVIAGNRMERANCRDYITWLLNQRDGRVIIDPAGREDVEVIRLDPGTIGWFAGPGGLELRKIEDLTQVFCFLSNHARTNDEQVLICGYEPGWQGGYEGRSGAKKMIEDLLRQRTREKGSSTSWGGHGSSNDWGGYGAVAPSWGGSKGKKDGHWGQDRWRDSESKGKYSSYKDSYKGSYSKGSSKSLDYYGSKSYKGSSSSGYKGEHSYSKFGNGKGNPSSSLWSDDRGREERRRSRSRDRRPNPSPEMRRPRGEDADFGRQKSNDRRGGERREVRAEKKRDSRRRR